tara:strand:- start:989 stop:2653 length:1665 start_codon:yes stop_codon:yes gene_type:complete
MKPPQDKLRAADPIKSDFRNFLFLAWKHLGLPPPTAVQYDIAKYLQHGPKRLIIEAFRGVGKSWITSAFVVWRLLCDPQLKFLVVSASKQRADDFSTFTKRIIHEMEILQHLKARSEQRDSNVAFDVGPSRASHAPTVKSVGITGQIVGSRAHIIIADDVEVLSNALTQVMREKLEEVVKEFDAVVMPKVGRVVYLGTPQVEETLYNRLQDKGYKCRIWPALKPAKRLVEFYGPRLAPYINELDIPIGEPTDPDRFDSLDLEERKASYGKAGFARQFMLDTSGEDSLRYPLKLADLLVVPLDKDKAPGRIQWAKGDRDLTLQAVGLTGDYFYKPFSVSEDYYEYTGCAMHIDPAGRGQDETGYCITKFLNGNIFVLKVGGLPGGYDRSTLKQLASLAAEFKPNAIEIEANFGDGMYTQLFKPVLNEQYNCLVEEIKHHKQKEHRILDTLEILMSQHRIIFNYEEIIRDYEDYKEHPQRQLFYQMTRLSRDKGSLQHDDRVDVLAMGVAYWKEQVEANREREYIQRREEAVLRGCTEFMNAAGQSMPEEDLWVKV